MKHLCGFIIGLALVTALEPAAAAVPKDVARRLHEAQQQHEQGEHEQAADTLSSLIENDPTLAEAHRLLGHVYLDMDRPAEARAAMVQAIAHGRFTGDVLATLIRIDRAASGREAALLATLPLMSALEPDEAIWLRLWAHALRNTGQADAAIGVLNAVAQQHADDPQSWLALANAQLDEGQLEDAATSFETAHHVGANEPRLPITLARLHRQLDRPDAALAWYDRALAGTSEGAERNTFLLEQAETQLAATLPVDKGPLERLTQNEDDQTARRAADLLARSAHDAGEQAEAIEWWRVAVKRGLDRPQVLAFLGSHHLNRGEHAEAVPFFQQYMASEGAGDTKQLRHLLIVSLIELGEHEQARHHLRAHIAQYGLDDTADKLLDRLNRRR